MSLLRFSILRLNIPHWLHGPSNAIYVASMSFLRKKTPQKTQQTKQTKTPKQPNKKKQQKIPNKT